MSWCGAGAVSLEASKDAEGSKDTAGSKDVACSSEAACVSVSDSRRRRESALSAHMATATNTTQLDITTAVLFSFMADPSMAATIMAATPATTCNPLKFATMPSLTPAGGVFQGLMEIVA
jgi:hypothetical protein